MASSITDRSSGVGTPGSPNGENATISVKVPVRVATTANITLSGAQTIDGVLVVANDRVLVKDQDTASENGIYVAATGAWTRAQDCADAGDLVTGTEVRVNAGSTNQGRWYCSSADPIDIGTDSITWARTTEGDMVKGVYDTNDDGTVDAADAVPWAGVSGKPSTFPPDSHTHDDRYYTESEVDALLAASSGVPTGTMADYVGSTAPTGWVLLSGRTIGNASSNATNRANADTATLFALLWDSFTNTELAIVDSAGSPSTRGASAAADFAANKALPVPDLRGRTAFGKDDMGGSAANRIAAAQKHGVNGATLGAAGGSAEHVLTEAEMPSHIHETRVTTGGGSASSNNADGQSASDREDTFATGGDEAHTNMPPFIVLNKIVKL